MALFQRNNYKKNSDTVVFRFSKIFLLFFIAWGIFPRNVSANGIILVPISVFLTERLIFSLVVMFLLTVLVEFLIIGKKLAVKNKPVFFVGVFLIHLITYPLTVWFSIFVFVFAEVIPILSEPCCYYLLFKLFGKLREKVFGDMKPTFYQIFKTVFLANMATFLIGIAVTIFVYCYYDYDKEQAIDHFSSPAEPVLLGMHKLLYNVYPIEYTRDIKFTWDNDEAMINLEKHRVRFEEAQTAFRNGPELINTIFDDETFPSHEKRKILIGDSLSRELKVSFEIQKGGEIRIFDAQLATEKEIDDVREMKKREVLWISSGRYAEKLEFKWDNNEADINFRDYGVSFEEAQSAFVWDNIKVIFDAVCSSCEKRKVLIGFSEHGRYLRVSFIVLKNLSKTIQFPDKKKYASMIHILDARLATEDEINDTEKVYNGVYPFRHDKNLNFEWDDDDENINLRKHKISFKEAQTVFDRYDDIVLGDEKRKFVIGYSTGRCLRVSFTRQEGGTIRIFNARVLTEKELEDIHNLWISMANFNLILWNDRGFLLLPPNLIKKYGPYHDSFK